MRRLPCARNSKRSRRRWAGLSAATCATRRISSFRFSPVSCVTRGQEIAVEVDESQSVPLNLRPGEMSLHHVRLVHGSAPNPSLDRRIGFAIRYIPTSIRQLEGEDSATLVRGEDRFHYFEHEPSPRIDMDPALLELHRQIAARNAKILYRGTGVTSFNDPAALRG